jgi:hypothetical protein
MAAAGGIGFSRARRQRDLMPPVRRGSADAIQALEDALLANILVQGRPLGLDQLDYRIDAAGTMITSTGWSDSSWEAVRRSHVLTVDRRTLQIDEHERLRGQPFGRRRRSRLAPPLSDHGRSLGIRSQRASCNSKRYIPCSPVVAVILSATRIF